MTPLTNDVIAAEIAYRQDALMRSYRDGRRASIAMSDWWRKHGRPFSVRRAHHGAPYRRPVTP